MPATNTLSLTFYCIKSERLDAPKTVVNSMVTRWAGSPMFPNFGRVYRPLLVTASNPFVGLKAILKRLGHRLTTRGPPDLASVELNTGRAVRWF